MYVLFGAGEIGRSVARVMQEHGIADCIFCDETPRKIGEQIDGVPVVSLTEANSVYRNCQWIATIMRSASRPVVKRLQQMGLNAISVIDFMRKKLPAMLPYACIDHPEVATAEIDKALQVATFPWEDRVSYVEYINQVRFRCGADLEVLGTPDYSAIIYLPDRYMFERVTFVDGGAFNGNTLRDFIQYPYKEILCFEPDPVNYTELVNSFPLIDETNISFIPAALSNEKGEMRFKGLGSQSSCLDPNGEIKVETRALDNLSLKAPIFIKLDVEGAEMDALHGAEKTIRNTHPLLAISVYHKTTDLWQLPLYIQSLYEGYRYRLIPHTEIMDLVLYCIPEGWPK